ncbi:Mobile element protein [Francisella sp. MA067296]|nr:Mobile element protein [Francisella sp. MA067296]
MPRTHGYSSQGQRCYGVCDWGARGRTNVIGALIDKVLFALELFRCNIDSVVFSKWIKYFLLPSLKTKTVIVMDNATFHKNTDMLKMIADAEHIIEFLPPYSPDLNPIEDIDHTKTKANSPQTNGICERFQKTTKNECYETMFRKKVYSTIEEIQQDVDIWLDYYNNERPILVSTVMEKHLCKLLLTQNLWQKRKI